RAQIEHGFEIMAAVGPKRDEGAGGDDSPQVGDVASDHVSEIIVMADPNDGHQVGLAGNGVHLGHSFDVGQFCGQVGDAGRLGIDQDESVHHGAKVAGVESPARYDTLRTAGTSSSDVTTASALE